VTASPGPPGPPGPPGARVAVVTGGGSGIGLATCARLAQDGFTVAALDLDPSAAAGPATLALRCDVRDESSITASIGTVLAQLGGIDVLVNNAGIMKLANLADSDDALFDSQVVINLKGVFNTLREAAKRLRGGGRIINLSSSVVGLCPATYGVYAATKAGVEAMTHVLTKELRGRNITVNAIAPGPTATALFLDGKPQAVIDNLAKAAPLERLGQPEDIAAAVAFLVSPDGAWINGQVLRANGGII